MQWNSQSRRKRRRRKKFKERVSEQVTVPHVAGEVNCELIATLRRVEPRRQKSPSEGASRGTSKPVSDFFLIAASRLCTHAVKEVAATPSDHLRSSTTYGYVQTPPALLRVCPPPAPIRHVFSPTRKRPKFRVYSTPQWPTPPPCHCGMSSAKLVQP